MHGVQNFDVSYRRSGREGSEWAPCKSLQTRWAAPQRKWAPALLEEAGAGFTAWTSGWSASSSNSVALVNLLDENQRRASFRAERNRGTRGHQILAQRLHRDSCID